MKKERVVAFISAALCENPSPARDDIPVNPVSAFQPYFTKHKLKLAEGNRNCFHEAGRELHGKKGRVYKSVCGESKKSRGIDQCSSLRRKKLCET